MGIVDRLRFTEKFGIFKAVKARKYVSFDEAADLIERLRGYAVHLPYCQSLVKGLHENPCTCGLSALIKEIDRD